jgi:hypothetical protein
MPVHRLLPVFLSILFTIGLWFYGVTRLQTGGVRQGGYAALVCGEANSDHEIRERLDRQDLAGLISESDQWFLLDCFGSIEEIPLVEYEERLLPFDPRIDGYAEKLKNIFVRDGKRFVYIPLGINRADTLETVIAMALTGIPYSLEYAQSPKRNSLFPFIMFCLSACAFPVIPVLRRRLNAGLAPCLLALSPLALGNAPGFALAALLAGFAALLAEPDRKLPAYSGRQRALPRGLPKPFTAQWLLAFALIACYGLFSLFCGLPVLFAFFVLVSFCCVFAVSFISGNPQGSRFSIKLDIKKLGWYPQRRRFTPVEILSRNTSSYGFFTVMLPFAVMAMALAFVGFARPQPPLSPNVSPLPAGAITEADFQEHFLFQSAFSFRPLGKTYEDGGLPPVIADYELSSNGLIDPGAPDIYEELQIPDFPLGDLLRGLGPDSTRAGEQGNRGNFSAVDLLFALLPMLFILPALVYSIRKKRQGKIAAGFSVFFR